MCGIFGAYGVSLGDCDLSKVFDSLEARGPDDNGYSFEANQGLIMAHTRLAIHDLSPLGHQPMTSTSERFEIVYNGEVYNYLELKEELTELGHFFRGTSDTEVLLASFEEYGVEASLKRFIGMFALSVLDRESSRLFLARDRMGEKPLYYSVSNNKVTWASTILALKAVKGCSWQVSRAAIAKLLRYGYIPAPYSVYDNVLKLMPGCYAQMDLSEGASSFEIKEYWSVESQVSDESLSFGSDIEAINTLSEVLDKAVIGQMQADVPLGAFLSGGVDSSLVVALMQKLGHRKTQTFSLGFEDPKYNEAPFAKAVADHLGTEHTEVIVTSEDALSVIPKLPSIYGEPFADSSQIPTVLVSQIAREHVTVALSGDGGDELFHGYSRYQIINERFNKLDSNILRSLGGALSSIPLRQRNLIQHLSNGKITSRRIKAMGESMSARDAFDLYNTSVSLSLDSDLLVVGATDDSSINELIRSFVADYPRDFALNDMKTYLPDDILTKVDSAAMSVSLETRVPLLDKNVVEMATRLPLSYKLRGGTGKWILRQLLYRYVPQEMIDRPKKGFAVPLGEWLRSDLRDWCEELLDPQTLKQGELFDVSLVRAIWEAHLRGGDLSMQLWPILMVNAWLREN